MHELAIDEVAQVSGGLTFYSTYKGVFILSDGEVMQPSPGPVIQDVS